MTSKEKEIVRKLVRVMRMNADLTDEVDHAYVLLLAANRLEKLVEQGE